MLSSYVVDELRAVIARKAPSVLCALDEFLIRLPFEMCYTPSSLPAVLPFEIRDPEDVRVLYSAIIAEADILITGDKDFLSIDLEKPGIMTPAQFTAKFL